MDSVDSSTQYKVLLDFVQDLAQELIPGFKEGPDVDALQKFSEKVARFKLDTVGRTGNDRSGECPMIEEPTHEDQRENEMKHALSRFGTSQTTVMSDNGSSSSYPIENKQKVNKPTKSTAKSKPTNKNTNGRKAKAPVRWTEEQDKMLQDAVAMNGPRNWKTVAVYVKGRDHVQCLQRWNKVLQPGLVKGPWTTDEDNVLKQLVALEKIDNWASVAAKIPGRTAKQCRERWRLNLDPAINHDPFTPEEDKLLLMLHEKNRKPLGRN
mmetsp:Transcript_41418/g.66553  ORF Transcript_41418/g.66553 Transcript_41418/m.66553 type:complete len:266 (-) Transcript_41418:845-1642(-)